MNIERTEALKSEKNITHICDSTIRNEVLKVQVEVRSQSVKLAGYVNVVKRNSRILNHKEKGSFIEQIDVGAFQRALERAKDVKLLFNHKAERELGSIVKGNLKLKEDAIGLKVECEITDPEVVEYAKKNKLSGWSFSFECLRDKWFEGFNGVKRRLVQDLNLSEVSILTVTPAYTATSVEMRSYSFDEDQYLYNKNLIKLKEIE